MIDRQRIAPQLAGLLALLLLASAGSGWAQVPNETNFQGKLVGPGGAALAGPVNIEIRVFDQLTDGVQLYGELHQNVPLVDGVFDVIIGTGSFPSGSYDAETFGATDRFLEVLVDAELLTPRQPFTATPYTFQAEVAQGLAPGAALNLSITTYLTFCNFGNAEGGGSCPSVETSAVHNFCALTEDTASPTVGFETCDVDRNSVDGTWDLRANGAAGAFVQCQMTCF